MQISVTKYYVWSLISKLFKIFKLKGYKFLLKIEMIKMYMERIKSDCSF